MDEIGLDWNGLGLRWMDWRRGKGIGLRKRKDGCMDRHYMASIEYGVRITCVLFLTLRLYFLGYYFFWGRGSIGQVGRYVVWVRGVCSIGWDGIKLQAGSRPARVAFISRVCAVFVFHFLAGRRYFRQTQDMQGLVELGRLTCIHLLPWEG